MVAPLPARQREPRRQAPQARGSARASATAPAASCVALLLLAAGGVAAVAALSALDGGGIDAPNEGDVRSQVQELKSLIREYAE